MIKARLLAVLSTETALELLGNCSKPSACLWLPNIGQLDNVAVGTISKCGETPIVPMSNNRKLLIEKSDTTTLINDLYEGNI